MRTRRRRGAPRSTPEAGSEPGELNIVPFLDIVVNLLVFLLATVAAGGVFADIGVTLPGRCVRCDGEPGLDLQVELTEAGHVVRRRGGRLAPGCEEDARDGGPTVAVIATGYDHATLGRCLMALHEANPTERQITITAAPRVPYRDVIATMDAARGDRTEAAFDQVRISVGGAITRRASPASAREDRSAR